MKRLKRKNPARQSGAEVSLHSQLARKIITAQIKSGYFLKVFFRESHRVFYIPASDDARSFLLIAVCKQGITRAEALKEYFILSLTQHAHRIRKACEFWDVIETERIKPKRYARYHLGSGVTVQLFKQVGK